MRWMQAIWGAVLTALFTLGPAGQVLGSSHQAAGQAQKAEKLAAPTTRRHVGTVKVVDPVAGTLTVSEKDGEVTVSVGEKAAIKKRQKNVMLKDLKPGDEVTIRYVEEDGKDAVRSVTVREKK